VSVGREQVTAAPEQGYVSITREWRAGDTVELDLPMRVHLVRGNEKIASTAGQVAFERGPVVYCFEGADQPIAGITLTAPIHASTQAEPRFLGGVTKLKIEAAGGVALTAIPYYAWDNRGLTPMTVWLPEQ
jgi:DUF1680 family protein